tara:strand:- start:561 stop:896 length:336 start_codon:yes stop_codon:yes gene_type:complete
MKKIPRMEKAEGIELQKYLQVLSNVISECPDIEMRVLFITKIECKFRKKNCIELEDIIISWEQCFGSEKVPSLEKVTSAYLYETGCGKIDDEIVEKHVEISEILLRMKREN